MLSAEELARIKQLEATSQAQTEKDFVSLKEKQAQGYGMEQQQEQ